MDYLSDKHKDLAKKAIVESTGSGGRVGINEVLRKGTVEKLTVENRVASEMGIINKLLGEIAQNSSKIAYGEKETIQAINLGAVEKLLIIDTKLAQEDIASYMEIVENMSGEVMVISSEHEGGNQLSSLGGFAAFLRYPIN